MPTIHHGDCIETMNAMPPESVDAIVTDPPYGLSFMQAKWDATPPGVQWAEACYRVLKPGGHIAAFGGTRTWHRLAVAIEDAGFEMRDSLAWLYGSGFPKSHDVSKAIDKLNGRKFEDRYALGRHIRERRIALGLTPADVNAWFGYKDGCQHWERQDPSGARVPTLADWAVLKPRLGLSDEHLAIVERVEAERAVIGKRTDVATRIYDMGQGPKLPAEIDVTAPATPEAEQWDGWGTALKPAFEPIVLARKPLAEKTVARNVLAHGTGAINVDACRIAAADKAKFPAGVVSETESVYGGGAGIYGDRPRPEDASPSGRWPANVLLDQHAAAWVDEQSGDRPSSGVYEGDGSRDPGDHATEFGGGNRPSAMYADKGGASRFFYTAKAPKSERPNVDGVQHPTVKPLAIMRWLIRLVTPPGGTVLDPFAGSGTTIEAALIEGFDPVGIEMETDYLPLIQHRIDRQAGTLTA